MNSEKIKALKEFIEVSAELGYYYKLANCDVGMLDVIEYINELESENERLLNEKWDKEDDLDNYHIENQQLKHRIADLESELEKEQINNLNCDTELQYKEKRIAELEKKNDEQYKRIMELKQDLVHADEKVFYRECNVTLRENEIKQQAIKQFTERLKEKCEYNRKQYCCSATVGANDIDETLKEFINKGDEER